jgi:hypothetical protein
LYRGLIDSPLVESVITEEYTMATQTDNPTNRANEDAHALLHLEPGQSMASVVQREVHDARHDFTNPADYNKYISTMEGKFTNTNQDPTVDAIRFFGSLELHDPSDVQNAQNGKTGATGDSSWLGGISTTLGMSSSEQTQALDHLGFKGDGARGDFRNIYGASVDDKGNVVIDASKPQENKVTVPSDGGSVSFYSDGSSRGFHYATDANGQPTLDPKTGQPVVDAVNETDANGYSRKLVLRPDGSWVSGPASTQFGVADVPGDNAQVVQYNPNSTQDNGVAPLDKASNPGGPPGDVGPAGSLPDSLAPLDTGGYPPGMPTPAQLVGQVAPDSSRVPTDPRLGLAGMMVPDSSGAPTDPSSGLPGGMAPAGAPQTA